MTKAHFVYNLRPKTYDQFLRRNLSPYGYLLAPNNVSRTTERMANSLRAARKRLVVDNGNFTLIGRIRKDHKSEARQLWKEVQARERAVKRSLRPRDVPSSLRDRYRRLARTVREEAKDLTGDGEEMLAEQLGLNPTHLIGVEDITAAAWLGLDIERAYTGFSRRRYRRMNESVARRARHRLDSLPEELAQRYYPVASGVSYNTARDAGRVFAEAGLDRASMGFGAFMADSNYTDYLQVGRKKLRLDTRVPTRYLRTVAVACGFWEGYEDAAGKPPEAFHFLGLGAPIMIPFATLCAWGTKLVTFDATSPIKDALKGGTLYVSKPAYLKVRTRKVAFRLASDQSRVWGCPCPFCTDFESRHPFRYELGHTWFVQEGGRKVVAGDLRPGGGLFDAYPLFSEPGGGEFRKSVDFARIGHNHWVLERITASLRRASATREKLETRTRNIAQAYQKQTAASFSKAISFSLRLAMP